MNDWTRISDGKVHHHGRFHGENNERAKHRRGKRRKYESYARSSIYIYIYFITHEKKQKNSAKKKSSRVSFFKWPVKSRSLVGLMLPFFHSTRRSGISPLSTLFFERARSSQSLATDQETFEAATIQPRYSNDLKDVLSPTLSSSLPSFFSPFYHVLSRLRSVSSFLFFPAAPARWILKGISSAIYVRIRAN